MSTDFITNICSALEQTSSTNNVKRQEAEGYIQQVSLSFFILDFDFSSYYFVNKKCAKLV